MELVGARLSHYLLLDKLGQGGMGAVYRAQDVRLGRHVALKILPPASADDAEARERFLIEARAAASLEHPNICLLYEFGEAEGQPFIAMQLVEGETLKQATARGPLGEGRTREVLEKMASALSAAHARNIIHRDVKSANILLGRDGSIKLADFGLARLTAAAGLTSSGMMMGTPSYLAPEQLAGGHATEAGDQFSLAAVAYECLTGTLPFAGESLTAVLYAVANLDPEPPSYRSPGIHPDWDALVRRGMAKESAERYASMEEFGRAAAACGGGIPAVESRPAAAPHAVEPRGITTPAPAASTTPSLAVLFFANLSNDPDSDYFCAGITEDILTDLSKVPGLKVASRNAVERYRGKSVELRTVAAELGVTAIVEGSVRRAGNRVRITAQLVDPGTSLSMWADRYDRTLEDVFAVQEDIAHAIASALRGALSPAEAVQIQRSRPAGVEAYDIYLKGRDLYRRYTRKDNRAALECFERAVEVDPGYALAWAGIADCCAQMHDRAWDADPQWLSKGFAAAQRSIELDPHLAEGHKAEALLWRTRRDHERAVAALQRALAADPEYIPGLINLGQELLNRGDFAGAEHVLRQAAAIDPSYGFSHLLLGAVLFYTRRYEAAVESLHRAQNEGMSPFYATYCYPMRAHALAEEGDLAAAAREVSGGRAANIPAPILNAADALVEALWGHEARVSELLEALDREPPGESYGCEIAAAAAARLGRTEMAVRFLRAAERIDERHWAYWRISPDFQPILRTHEFKDCIGERGRRMVWPSESPPLPLESRAQFSDYSEASGMREEARVGA